MSGFISDKLKQMPADILVVTPVSEVGETVRRVLEETTLYRVHIVNNKASAIVRANEMGIPLAMLDLALGREWVEEIGAALRTTQKGINLILLNDQTVTPPAFESLRPWILVRKPFTMTEFMTAISQPQSAAPETSDEKTHPWLGDKTKAAQRLTRLTLSSSAQAALITRKNELWAYAGGLSQEAAKELAQAVSRNWNSQKGADLLRFIRLESTKAEHMLYATNLTGDSVLAFVFEAETPFSAIRNQAGKLVEDLDAMELQKQALETSQPAEDESLQTEENIPPISNILVDIPSPNPSKNETGAPRKKAEKIVDFDPNETLVSEPLADAAAFSRESSPAMRLTPTLPPREVQPASRQRVSVDVEARPVTPVAPSSLEETRPTATAEKRPLTPVAAPSTSADVTRESPTTEAAKKLTIESASAGMYHLSYACLLVPRFSTHYITGDLSNRLETEWLPNICIAFGWRLEYLAARPEYLQWVVNVQPNTSPGHLMRIIRQQSSDKIFAEFPRFKRENTSNDFWAPGYLIMGGAQPHPAQLVRDYINQTRRRQGLHQEAEAKK